MEKIYVVWQDVNGGFYSDIYKTDKPLNHKTIKEVVLDSLSYYAKDDFARIISWQKENYE